MWLGLLAMSMLIGAAAATVGLVLGQPLWVAILLYSVAGSVSLALAGSGLLWAMARTGAPAAPQPGPVPAAAGAASSAGAAALQRVVVPGVAVGAAPNDCARPAQSALRC